MAAIDLVTASCLGFSSASFPHHVRLSDQPRYHALARMPQIASRQAVQVLYFINACGTCALLVNECPDNRRKMSNCFLISFTANAYFSVPPANAAPLFRGPYRPRAVAPTRTPPQTSDPAPAHAHRPRLLPRSLPGGVRQSRRVGPRRLFVARRLTPLNLRGVDPRPVSGPPWLQRCPTPQPIAHQGYAELVLPLFVRRPRRW